MEIGRGLVAEQVLRLGPERQEGPGRALLRQLRLGAVGNRATERGGADEAVGSVGGEIRLVPIPVVDAGREKEGIGHWAEEDIAARGHLKIALAEEKCRRQPGQGVGDNGRGVDIAP